MRVTVSTLPSSAPHDCSETSTDSSDPSDDSPWEDKAPSTLSGREWWALSVTAGHTETDISTATPAWPSRGENPCSQAMNLYNQIKKLGVWRGRHGLVLTYLCSLYLWQTNSNGSKAPIVNSDVRQWRTGGHDGQ